MIVKHCNSCGSERMMKDGFAPNGKQRFRCGGCGQRSRENPDQGHSQQLQEQVLRAYDERMSMRGIARTFGISRNTLAKWLKKDEARLAQRSKSGVGYLEPTLLPAQVGDVLEIDEMWSFVSKKKNKV